uniref:Uncharacterized protein n=1 Tax=Myoviridae sp. ctCpP1 TaxID=2825054 RepID=A0A8S5V7L3_9CAUD|nr:MAG TPA: hypothetical protein [Myoviridae sp. ctCpP1]
MCGEERVGGMPLVEDRDMLVGRTQYLSQDLWYT